MNTIYDRIEQRLQETGMNKRQLSELSGMPYSTLIAAFNRRSDSFSFEYLNKIAETLDVDVQYLLTGKTTAQHDAEYIESKRQSLEETKATNALFRAYGFNYKNVEVEGELPYRSDLVITAPDGTQTRLTHDGNVAYGTSVCRELKQYALYLHERTIKELAEADKARKEGAEDGKEEASE
ncbi:helix-turn-helix transcriptional regulator [Eubacteriales bacterium OttesenSCG-928-A19]|nr:helix-turn-helix transcriptional regulator [Eubacteriales bacterium OttesenSCG-928-A19]